MQTVQKIRFGFILILSIFSTMVFSQTWSWIETLPNSAIRDIKVLPSGTIIITGSFTDLTMPDSLSAEDYAVLELDSTGRLVKGIQKNSNTFSQGYHIGTDNEGGIYVFGKPFTPAADHFLLKKFTTSGALVWTRKLLIPNSLGDAYLPQGAAGMDVQYGRIAITGNFKQELSIFNLDQATIEKKLGAVCNPGYDSACPTKNDVFIIAFDESGGLVFDQKFGTPVQYQKSNEHIGYVTTADFDDFGWDVAIDPGQNILFIGHFVGDPTVFFGSLQLPLNNKPVLVKMDNLGQPLWAKTVYGHSDFQDPFPSKIGFDGLGNAYMAGIMDDNAGFEYRITKYTPAGTELWMHTINVEMENTEIAYYPTISFAWHVEEHGISFFAANFTLSMEDETESSFELLQKINSNGQREWEYSSEVPGGPRLLATDIDGNIYLGSAGSLGKWVQRLPHSFLFSGNGLYSNTLNWQNHQMPPPVLPKWDTIYIQTAPPDSCVLDTAQVILTGAILDVKPGSHLIVAGNIQFEPLQPAPTPISATGSFRPEQVQQGEKTLITVKVSPGKYPASTNVQVKANLQALGGLPEQFLFDNGTNGDVSTGDLAFSFLFSVPADSPAAMYSIPFIVSDNEERTDTGNISLQVSPKQGSSLVISQIYGGGGITGATYKNDFVEVFNRGTTPILLDGISLQYASAAGSDKFGDQTPAQLTGSLQPGQYCLISLASGSTGNPLPITPNAGGTINISQTNGKIILVNSTLPLDCNGSSTPCNSAQKAKIIDLVGYGNANFYETQAAPALVNGNVNALHRYWDGCAESDNNNGDFYVQMAIPRNKENLRNLCNAKPVISQVYGGAGEEYAGLHNDFIELFNAGSAPQNLTGWSVQYADSTGTNWQVTPLTGTIQPGKYFLIAQAYHPAGTSYLPTPDVIGNINLHPASGKVALVKNNTALNENCTNSTISDLVGYGTADCYEGSNAAPGGSGTLAVFRKENGCVDTDQNGNDFITGNKTPRNSSSPLSTCKGRINENWLVDVRDGKVYPIKRYGTQIWMTANLNYNQTGSKMYDNDPANAAIFGRLYNWDQAKAACPSGWHLPGVSEWSTVRTYIATSAAMRDTMFWTKPNINATNSSGFSARPAGYWDVYFEEKGTSTAWWTSTQGHSELGVYHWAYGYWFGDTDGPQIGSFWEDRKELFESVRCVKN